MTLNRFLEAIASKLRALWPERAVYTDKIPKDADGGFYICIVDSEQEKRLDRRHRRTLSFEVRYMLRSDDTMAFNNWAEDMYDNFGTATVREDEERFRTIKLMNSHARHDNGERIFQFLCDADFYFILAPEDAPAMENLMQEDNLKQ